MNQRIRDVALSVIAAAVLPFVFVALQSLLAHYSAATILAVADIVGRKVAILSVVYSFGVIGALTSAIVVALPLGWALKQRPYLTGVIVGLVAAGYLGAISSGELSVGALLEFAILVIGASLAAGLGNSLKREEATSSGSK
jgi:hypothetical protein